MSSVAKPELNKGVSTYFAKDRKQWRKWLEKNSHKEPEVYLILHNKKSTMKSVSIPEAVEEALCSGWIDSFKNKRDEGSAYQRFSPRRPNSNWSEINKARAEKLIAQGLMTPAGQQAIDLAKQKGIWR
ncbi:MAG: hypothetical protein EOO06_02880 [Chitinophagaceae bacterium]|nr:MAG: hypothetical protein EOO06_02880 [Chitinophagaceae bacterium]